MTFKRARSDKQIQERKKEIIDAASKLYDTVGYDGLNFSVISEYTKFTRPSIYKYFKTKDEILLMIIKEDMKSWLLDLSKAFKLNKLYSIYEITEIWTNILLKHTRLLELYSLLFTSIEKNVSVKALAQFKKETLMLHPQMLELVSQLFPKARNDSILNFIYAQLTLAFGLYPMTKLSNLQLEAIALSGLNYTSPDFKKTYMASLYQLMYCLENVVDIND